MVVILNQLELGLRHAYMEPSCQIPWLTFKGVKRKFPYPSAFWAKLMPQKSEKHGLFDIQSPEL